MYDKIIITDYIDLTADLNKCELIVLWDKEYDKDNIISIPKYLHENKVQVRKELLQVINNIETTNINGQSILKHLEIEDNFSYWWLTSLGQLEPFSNGKNIYEIIKLICLNKILDNYQFDNLIIDLKDSKNFEIIYNSVIGKNISFKIKPLSKRQNIFKINYNYIYLFIGFIKFCFSVFERTQLKKFQNIKKSKSYDSIFYDILHILKSNQILLIQVTGLN